MVSTLHDLTDEDVKSMREQYEIKMEEYYSDKAFNGPWTQKCLRYVKKMLRSKDLPAFELVLLQKYIKGKYFISRRKHGTSNKLVLARILKLPDTDVNVPVLPWEHAFDVILSTHVECGHGNITKTMSTFRTKCFVDIPCVYYALQLCPVCNRNADPSDPKTISVYNKIGSLEILDMTAKPDGVFNYILIYTDEGTGFVHLRAIADTVAIHIASKLTDIFTDFGPPTILRIYDTSLIYDYAIEIVNTFFEECPITVEAMIPTNKRIENVKNLILEWMSQENTEHWEFGCYSLQWKMNNATSSGTTKHDLVFKGSVQTPSEDADNQEMETDYAENSTNDHLETKELTTPANSEHKYVLHDEAVEFTYNIHNSQADTELKTTSVNVYDDVIIKEEYPLTHEKVKSDELDVGTLLHSPNQKSYCNKRSLRNNGNALRIKTEPQESSMVSQDSCASTSTKSETNIVKKLDTLLKNSFSSDTKLCSECYKAIKDESYTCKECMNSIHGECGEKINGTDAIHVSIVCWSCENKMKHLVEELT